ncbi:transposase [Dokdonia pacifica]|nr:tyrosine-type recombinase/integrase [Dokdonia pacifica]GGG29368.1 transposase [Dokdonia pacifica]
MKSSTFFLRKPKGDKKTLILFSCNFQNEGKKFVYSTGETILPMHWDFKNRSPKTQGKKDENCNTIKNQIARYSKKLGEVEARCTAMDEDFTSQILRREFDKEFKKTKVGASVFFDAYDDFMSDKIKLHEWSHSTIKRYKNIKNILKDFEKDRSYKLTFSKINSSFHSEFTDYCLNDKEHITNTYSRNLGLFKTFMFWALKKHYTYNTEFESFKKKERVITKQIALSKDDIDKLLQTEFKIERLEKVRDIFIFCCVTGMRFGELKLVNIQNIINDKIILKEEKSVSKKERKIPIPSIGKQILKKYNYKLPLVSNQKMNKAIKEVFQETGYTYDVEKTTTRGKEVIREKMPYFERIGTHTARRTYITMMKSKGKSDKLISEITGHRDIKTLNQYYQVDDTHTANAVDDVFGDFEYQMKNIS